MQSKEIYNSLGKSNTEIHLTGALHCEAVMSKFIIEVTFSQTKTSDDTCECFAFGSILEYTVVVFTAEGQIEEGRVTIYIPMT